MNQVKILIGEASAGEMNLEILSKEFKTVDA